MKIAGIIAEYNPFHSGHAYHIAQTREKSHCDYVVVCMSGSFTQRGDAACLRARDRARAALLNGADAVVELPTINTVRTADAFAFGGAAILNGLGCDLLSFGSESDDIDMLEKLAAIRLSEPAEISERIRISLAKGESHARARGLAVAEYLNIDPVLMNSPNLILASEYICAIRKMNSEMKPMAIARVGGYHDQGFNEFASASAIRSAVTAGDRSAYKYVPREEAEALEREKMHSMDDILLYRLRGMTDSEYAELPDAAEGLDRRIRRAANECRSRDELIAAVKCKRYTYARISRICTQALLRMTKQLIEAHSVPQYVRLIGVRGESMPLLKELKKRSVLPIISDAAELRSDPAFQLDLFADDVRSLLCENNRQTGKLFTEKFLIV